MSNSKISKESAELLEQLRTSEVTIRTDDGKEFPVSKLGSLGLLALGYRGIIAWRKIRQQN